jgi:type I restriction enzyme S subunit
VSKTEIRVNPWNPTKEGQLPAGWWWTTIRDVADDTQIGIVRSKAQQNRAGKGVPYLKMNNLTMDGKVTADDVVFIEATQDEIDRFSVRAGDILFNTRNSVELVGKTGIVTGEVSGSIYNNNLMRIRTKPNVSSLFVAYQMCSPDFRRRMERVKRSTTNVAALYAKDVLPLPIALPPIEQQKYIVAEIEKQFSRLDEAVANLKRVKANLKRYKAAVLKAAVEGKLTEEWRRAHTDVEPASELLKRILAERRAKWNGNGKCKEPEALEPAGLASLPDRWAWTSLDQLLLNVTDGDHQPPPQTDSGVPFLVIGNVRTGKLNFQDSRFVSREYADAVGKFRKPTHGDILYSLVGTYGIALRVNTDREFCIQRHIAVLRPHKRSPTDYLVHVLNSSFVFRQATAAATGTAQKTVPLAGLRRFAIPLPPLAEQERIAAEVERRLSVVEELEAVASANLQRGERLRQTILQRAFSGCLVVR